MVNVNGRCCIKHHREMNSHLCFEHLHKDILTSEYKACIIKQNNFPSFKLKCSFAKYRQVLHRIDIWEL